MADEALAFAPAEDLLAALRESRVSAEALTELFLDRAERLNPRAHALTLITPEAALEAARDCDRALKRGEDLGALAGLPFVSKDLIDVAGTPTSGGARGFAAGPAVGDATVVAKLRSAGALSLGKANLHAFAYGITGENRDYGTAVNAYDESRLAGGSSSGSAAAVAFGLAPLALGTDTGGSVRVPAALSGLVGLKPTYGRVSARGVLPFSWSMDHVGWIVRRVRDAALVLQVAAGYDAEDPASVNTPVGDYLSGLEARPDLTGITIGVPRTHFFERAETEILAAAEAALQALERAGARLLDVALPDMTQVRSVALAVQMPEALSVHGPWLKRHPEAYSDDFRAGLALAQFILADHYLRAKRMMTHYRRETEGVLDAVDGLLTPSIPILAAKVGTVSVEVGGVKEPLGNAFTRNTTFFNLTGHPAITLPSGLSSQGLPMGVQLVGRYFEEAKILRVAAALEAEERFHLPPPRL